MKKIASLSIVIILLITMFTACSGGKNEVLVNIDINGQIKSVSVKTNKETLEEVLVDNVDKLDLTLTDSDYGKFIAGANGYVADAAKNEFFELLVNDESSQVGIKEVIVADNDIYTIKLAKF